MNCSEFASDKHDLPQFSKVIPRRSNDDKMFTKPQRLGAFITDKATMNHIGNRKA